MYLLDELEKNNITNDLVIITNCKITGDVVSKIKEITSNGQFNNNIEEKVIPKVKNIVSKEVNDTFYEDTIKETQLFIAHKMIKDNLSKQQVIKYCQLSDEEYETLKKLVFDK